MLLFIVVAELNAVCIWLLYYWMMWACGSFFAFVQAQCCKCTACKPQVPPCHYISAPRPRSVSNSHEHVPDTPTTQLNRQLLCHLVPLSSRDTSTTHAAAGCPWWKKRTPKSTILCRIGNCCLKCAVRLPRAIQACERGAAQEPKMGTQCVGPSRWRELPSTQQAQHTQYRKVRVPVVAAPVCGRGPRPCSSTACAGTGPP